MTSKIIIIFLGAILISCNDSKKFVPNKTFYWRTINNQTRNITRNCETISLNSNERESSLAELGRVGKGDNVAFIVEQSIDHAEISQPGNDWSVYYHNNQDTCRKVIDRYFMEGYNDKSK